MPALIAWVQEAGIIVSGEDEFVGLVQAFGAGFRAGQRASGHPAKYWREDCLTR